MYLESTILGCRLIASGKYASERFFVKIQNDPILKNMYVFDDEDDTIHFFYTVKGLLEILQREKSSLLKSRKVLLKRHIDKIAAIV